MASNKKFSIKFFCLILSVFVTKTAFSPVRSKPKKSVILLKVFKKILPAVADKTVLTGSFAVYLHSLNFKKISIEERQELLMSVEDFDLVIYEPKTVGTMSLESSFKEKSISFTKTSSGFLIEGIKIDLVKKTGSGKGVFKRFYDDSPKLNLIGYDEFRLESVRELLARYTLNLGDRELSQQVKDEFKIKLLRRMIPKVVAPTPKRNGRKKFNGDLGGALRVGTPHRAK